MSDDDSNNGSYSNSDNDNATSRYSDGNSDSDSMKVSFISSNE